MHAAILIYIAVLLTMSNDLYLVLPNTYDGLCAFFFLLGMSAGQEKKWE